MVEQKTIRGCLKGDRSCQKQLYQSCAPYVYTIAKSYLKQDTFVKDVMQEAFASIFSSISRYDSNKGTFKSWIAKITTYRAIDFLKRNNKIEINQGLEAIEHLSENDFAHLDGLNKKEIEMLLGKMPTGYKTIFLLSAIDDFTHVEIGKMLEISPETSRSQYHRALKWIKKNISLTSNHIRYEAL